MAAGHPGHRGQIVTSNVDVARSGDTGLVLRCFCFSFYKILLMGWGKVEPCLCFAPLNNQFFSFKFGIETLGICHLLYQTGIFVFF